jgi:hypothetical protein
MDKPPGGARGWQNIASFPQNRIAPSLVRIHIGMTHKPNAP